MPEKDDKLYQNSIEFWQLQFDSSFFRLIVLISPISILFIRNISLIIIAIQLQHLIRSELNEVSIQLARNVKRLPESLGCRKHPYDTHSCECVSVCDFYTFTHHIRFVYKRTFYIQVICRVEWSDYIVNFTHSYDNFFRSIETWTCTDRTYPILIKRNQTKKKKKKRRREKNSSRECVTEYLQ